MNSKMITGLLLIILLINVATTFNVTVASSKIENSKETSTAFDDLLKDVDLNIKPRNTANTSDIDLQNLWDFSKISQKNTPMGYWGENSIELIVGLAETWGAFAKVEQMAFLNNGKIVNKVLMGNKVEAVVVDISRDFLASFLKEVKGKGLCRYVEPNLKYQAFMVPNDAYWSVQWGPQKIKAEYVWNKTLGSKSVLVCVIDTGIDYNHPDLAENYVPLGQDWVNNDPDPMDDMGHGTHCAGIIGAVINNYIGIAGLAQVRLMAEKGLDASGSGYYDDLANAIIHATDQNASIISMSWGGSTPSTLLHNALKYAYDHGVLLVAAAGNTGSSAKHYPAAYDEVIAVTATDPTDYPAWFTTYGDWVEISAPGVQIYSTISSVHYQGWSYPYDYLSGTSMACPHVVGVAALLWSRFPNMSRDVVRLHLRDTADDLGAPGFDIYYGYGRLNANRTIEEPLPEHDIFISNWRRPPYVEPSSTGRINVTMVNYGRYNETDVTVQLLVNGTVEHSTIIASLQSGTSITVTLPWTPTTIGNYNITVYIEPVVGETNLINNRVQGYVYVDHPLKGFVLRSAGTQYITEAWESLNWGWKKFGNQLIYIDYTTLDKEDITYEDLNATGADVLILSCAFAWEYKDAEIEAIKRYVYEGHGFIATAGTFYYGVPNNNKFGPIFGLNDSVTWTVTGTDLLQLLEPSHPLFAGVPNPYIMPAIQSTYPYDGTWSSNELAGGNYIAMGYYNESAIVVYRGLVYISPWLEAIPEYYHFNLQVLYNAITWSRYRKPEHELEVSLDAPAFMFPEDTTLLNATVTNLGVQDESNIKLTIKICDVTHNEMVFFQQNTITLLQSGKSYTMNHSWNPTVQALYNVTAYALPVSGEENVENNKVTVFVIVTHPLIEPEEGQWARYAIFQTTNITGQMLFVGKLQLNYSKYISPYLMNVTLLGMMVDSDNFTGWTVVNIMNRLCESGNWSGLWFPGMIETNIILNSSVNILYGQATVIGNESLVIGTKIVDCWKLYQTYSGIDYIWWYDKTNGLWIRLDMIYGQNRQIIVLDATNIPTGYTPEHELLVTLKVPSFVALGSTSAVNATVFNFGLYNETNVTLKLEINGTLVASLIPTNLTVNNSSTIYYPWTPLKEGIYNVTAYSPPVFGEDIISDNIATVWVKVRIVKGRVLFDQTHGTDSILLYSTWIMRLRDEGYVVDFHISGNITFNVLKNHDAFVIIQARTDYSSSELNAIREFVAKGGGLLVIGDDLAALYNNLTSFAFIFWTSAIGTRGFTSNLTPHEVTQRVSMVYLPRPDNTLSVSGNAQGLVRDYYLNIMLAVNWFQGGRVMGYVDEDSIQDSYIGTVNNLQLAVNMIAWLCKKDTTPPQISHISPSNGTVLRNTAVQISWSAIDSQSGINYYEIRLNGGAWINKGTSISHTFTDLSNGQHIINIRAWDKAGNSAQGQVTIFVDTEPPMLQIFSPANQSYVKGVVNVNVSGFDEHFGRLELLIDAKLVATFYTSGLHTYLWNTAFEYASHQITLVGYDTVGNNASVMVLVTVDNIAPIVKITYPTTDYTYIRGSLTITFVAEDLTLKNASLLIGDVVKINVTNLTLYVFDTTTLPDGNYTIKLVAYDWVENKAETSTTVTIDNMLPDAQITFPTNNAYVKDTVNITFTFADSNLENATLSVPEQILDVTNRASYSWDTTTLSNGNYILRLTVSDKAGNKKIHEISVTVDNTSPWGEIRAPLNNACLKGIINITFYGQDPNLKNMSLYIDGGIVPPYVWNISGIHSRLWNTTSGSDGNYTLSLEIFDKAGNKFTTAIIVIVDNTSPIASIISPQDAAPLSGKIIINFSVADINLANAVLFIDNVAIDVTGLTSYPLDTTELVDGDHTIKLVATDTAGNTKEYLITIKTSNAFPIYIWPTIAGVLGFALGALMVWLLLKIKRKPSPTPPTATPPPATTTSNSSP